MKRQSVGLISAVLVLSVLGLMPATGTPQMVSLVFNSAQQAPQQIGSDEFRRKLVELAENRIILDERGGNTLGSETAILAALRGGVVDMATLSGSVVSSAVPEFGVFDVPFLFRDAAQAKAVAEGPVGAALAKRFADKGLVLLAIGKQGFRNITNSKRPIRSPADLQGLKIRVLPNEVYQMTFKALGAEVVPMEFTLVYSALRDGRIDGQENPVMTIATSHLEEVQKHVSLTGHFFAPIAFVANRDMFQALKPADQATIIAAAKAGAEATWKAGAEEEAKKLDELRKGGMEIIEKVDRQPFIDAVKPLEPEFEKRFGKDVLAQIRATP
ncbi:TRAP transporter substrate-binding protein [Bradyrhizobium sp. CCGUVB1N3]|uniref:TRAP transporter substrate-binding protein n=1 Tax=Bradyrhizobium sp. CCGUVB1N3 TaxID=2949629 RepID=UPI0020B4522A|nr:TRAP transporter substrate-binding protein [Bradyrhizobium sp. CCGUVB1N3]MCP3473234.1 TRAP transporter substrate-binding protein [Bradyrhizobium sp. CCGUVB1N3]